jgi:uncharacterized membrane protein
MQHALLAQQIKLPDPDVTKNAPLKISGLSTFSFQSLGDIIYRAIPFVFAFAGVGLLIMLILGGFAFLTSAGDTKKLEGGKQRITHAIIGFLIIFVAYWVVQIVGTIFGLSAINLIFK